MHSDTRYLSPDEVRRALGRLGEVDVLRLVRLSRVWASRLRGRDSDDLLNEAFDRILSGHRRWPAHIPLASFVHQVMRSISAQWRREAVREPLLADLDAMPPETHASPHEDHDTMDLFARMRRVLVADPAALGVLEHILADSDRDEARAILRMSVTEYDTARRRMTRQLADTFEAEWNQ
jgi:DNA-directed RNA polymerase specialized sigma24 family protein